jgi:hypothetical protein
LADSEILLFFEEKSIGHQHHYGNFFGGIRARRDVVVGIIERFERL